MTISWALLAFAVLLLAIPALQRMQLSSFGVTNSGSKIYFDSRIRRQLYNQDFAMSKNGFIVSQKTIDTYEESGAEQLLAYNGMNMRLMKVVSTYTHPTETISHEKTAYQVFLSGMEKIFGRLNSFFYFLDNPDYIGESCRKETYVKIENMFLLCEDKQARFSGGGYYCYAGTSRMSETDCYTTVSESGEVINEHTDTAVSSTPHFEGDLTWLKSMAYNNYVSPYNSDSAFEKYDDVEKDPSKNLSLYGVN